MWISLIEKISTSLFNSEITPSLTRENPNKFSSLLENLKGFTHIASISLGAAQIEQEVYDFSPMFQSQNFPFLEIVVFIHNESNYWAGVRCIKYATWSRPNEEITEIYNHNNGSQYPSKARLEKGTKKLFVTPHKTNMICDIYVLKLF